MGGVCCTVTGGLGIVFETSGPVSPMTFSGLVTLTPGFGFGTGFLGGKGGGLGGFVGVVATISGSADGGTSFLIVSF